MNDDYSGDIFTTGAYSIGGTPIPGVLGDFSDSDWFRVDNFQRYFDYEINIFRSSDEDFTNVARLGVHDSNGNEVYSTPFVSSVPFRRNYQHFHSGTGDFFVDVNSGSGGYRLFIRKIDAVGNDIASAAKMSFNSRQFQASAIEKIGDFDYFKHKLYAGIEYEIDLLGVSSAAAHGTTLDNPLLKVFDEFGNLQASDNSSGTGTNSKVLFTPSTTALYFLQVSGANDTHGSYFLESDQFDDYANNATTTGVLPTDGSNVPGQSNFAFDIDWFRIEIEDGFTYKVVADAGLSLYDANGVIQSVSYPHQHQREFEFQKAAGQSSTFYVNAVSNVDYLISASVIDDRGSTRNDFENWNFNTDTVIGAIETPGDRDWFRATLASWGKYDLSITGSGDNPVNVPALSIRQATTPGLEVIKNGGTTPFSYSPNEPSGIPEEVFVDVRSNDPGSTGIYKLTFIASDHSAGDQSTRWNVNMTSKTGRIRDALETAGDVDWHRIHMKAETWYEFRHYRGTSKFQVIRPNGSAADIALGKRYFYAAVDGDYYIAMDAKDLSQNNKRSYETTILEGAKRTIISNAIGVPGTLADSIHSATNLGNRELVEVYSKIDLEFGRDVDFSFSVPAGQATTLTQEQFQTLETRIGFRGVAEVFVRSVDTRPGQQSAWGNVAIYGRPRAEALAADPADLPPFEVTFAFADGLPAYLAGDSRFTGFESLDSNERTTVETILDRWELSARNSLRFTLVAPGSGNDAAATMVFKAAIDSDVLAFRVGPDEGGDLVFNTNSPLMQDLSEGKQGFFEILRAAGYSLGLNELTHVDREISVMGVRDNPDIANLPFASYPTPIDIRAVRGEFDYSKHSGGVPGNTLYSLSGSQLFFRTIMDAGGEETVSAANAGFAATIDLRPGKASFTGTGQFRKYTFLNSYFSELDNGVGGNAGDTLIGNELNNVLTGGPGNDVLIGGIGFDTLRGGANNDTYIVRPGYGQEVILEQGEGGVDTLRIEGMHNLNSLADDVTFERLGNDLMVRLEWDSVANRNSDSIRIRDMTNVNSRVESLALLNPDGLFSRISLNSVFQQLSEPRQRFGLAVGSDNFGRLVAPV